jgi:DNA-binding PadR family transcriptional regulator
MLAVRPWTGYELTAQVRRSLRFIWPVSDGHLYREQKRLVALGWATVEEEPAGRRTRKRYTITAVGRSALAAWLQTEPEEPHFQIEGVLRMFFADHGQPAALENALRVTATEAGTMLAELAGFAEEYLGDGGPLAMLEAGLGGPDQDRREYHDRLMYPERLHAVSLAIDVSTRLLATLEEFVVTTADAVAGWSSTVDPELTAATRRRLESVVERAAARRPRAG